MEKNNKKERSCGSCKKFINAIGFGRDTSRGGQRPVAAPVAPATGATPVPNPNPAKKIAEPSIGPEMKHGGAGLSKQPPSAVKIENHTPLGPAPDKTGQNGGKKVEIQEQKVESDKTGVDIDNRIKEFLIRTREKMRTFSDIGGGKTMSRKESNKDHFMEYISRARNKLRTSSSFGVAKNSSSK